MSIVIFLLIHQLRVERLDPEPLVMTRVAIVRIEAPSWIALTLAVVVVQWYILRAVLVGVMFITDVFKLVDL